MPVCLMYTDIMVREQMERRPSKFIYASMHPSISYGYIMYTHTRPIIAYNRDVRCVLCTARVLGRLEHFDT